MAHFTLGPGAVSAAVRHRRVEEIWFILAGAGEMWRALAEASEIIALVPGLSLTIPRGAAFQFRNTGRAPLTAVAITMPPWPGPDEAVPATGPWA